MWDFCSYVQFCVWLPHLDVLTPIGTEELAKCVNLYIRVDIFQVAKCINTKFFVLTYVKILNV